MVECDKALLPLLPYTSVVLPCPLLLTSAGRGYALSVAAYVSRHRDQLSFLLFSMA